MSRVLFLQKGGEEGRFRKKNCMSPVPAGSGATDKQLSGSYAERQRNSEHITRAGMRRASRQTQDKKKIDRVLFLQKGGEKAE